MPRKPTGKPQWKAMAVKLPAAMIDELRRYTDLHNVSISDVIREGLDMRLHGAQPAPGSATLPAHILAMCTRLAATLTTAADALRSVGEGVAAPEASPQTPESQQYNGNTEYNGNTLPTATAPEPQGELSEHAQQSEVWPPFDPAKHMLGKVCQQ